MDITVLGAGSWGTSLAVQLARNGHRVSLWDRNSDRCAQMNQQRRNPRYLTSVPLPDNLTAVWDLQECVTSAELLVSAVPSHAVRQVMKSVAPHLVAGTEICCASKGIEEGSLDIMAQVIAEEVPESFHSTITTFSGPSFALELAQGLPTTAVVAGPDDGACHRAAAAFHGGLCRVYHTHDVIGVAIGGSLKNVIAIGCGISDGLEMGLNARAALITRGLAEITRLAVAMGADPITLMGLAGMGDLVLTCTGSLSRNRRVGLALGQGRTLDDILEELGEVAEGVITARSARDLGRKMGVELPLTEQIFAVIHEGKSAREALVDLLSRERRHERDEHR